MQLLVLVSIGRVVSPMMNCAGLYSRKKISFKDKLILPTLPDNVKTAEFCATSSWFVHLVSSSETLELAFLIRVSITFSISLLTCLTLWEQCLIKQIYFVSQVYLALLISRKDLLKKLRNWGLNWIKWNWGLVLWSNPPCQGNILWQKFSQSKLK